jgi:hypothetical protein
MAMVLELYLKAYAAKIAGTGDDVTRFGHKIADLYDFLQATDAAFPTHARLNPELSKLPLFELDATGWSAAWFQALPTDQQSDIRKNYEIYMAMAYAADLKYGVAPALPRHGQRIISSAWSKHNNWLIRFVSGVRQRIGHPADPSMDRIGIALKHPGLDTSAREYLRQAILSNSIEVQPTHQVK